MLHWSETNSHRGVFMSLMNASLHGDIEVTGFAEDLQSIVRLSNAGCLEIAHERDLGFISFADGKILAAITQHHDGINAMREILSWNSGSFMLEKSPQPAPTRGTIDLPLTVALLLVTQVQLA
jgi:Domain of unknown function (DUF4388)